MGTRSRIGVVEEDGSITSSYCHWDGYPSHHAPKLLQGFPDLASAANLMTYGSISSLGSKLGTRHNFEDRPDDTCTFYHRDRGDKGTDAVTDVCAEDFFETCYGTDAEWVYLFTHLDEPGDKAQWWYAEVPGTGGRWIWAPLCEFKEST